jgi:hypothetical protein
MCILEAGHRKDELLKSWSNRMEVMAQVVGCLPTKCEALNSNNSNAKKLIKWKWTIIKKIEQQYYTFHHLLWVNYFNLMFQVFLYFSFFCYIKNSYNVNIATYYDKECHWNLTITLWYEIISTFTKKRKKRKLIDYCTLTKAHPTFSVKTSVQELHSPTLCCSALQTPTGVPLTPVIY